MIHFIKHMAWKELIQLSRDKRMYPMIFLAPVIQMLLFGYAATLDVKHLPISILDQDRSQLSREYIDSLTKIENFDICCYVSDFEQIEDSIFNGDAKMGLVIPQDFESNVKIGKTTKVQLIVNGSDSNTGIIGLSNFNAVSQEFGLTLLINRITENSSVIITPSTLEDISPVDARIRVWYNPELKSRNYMVPGVIVMIMLITTLVLTAMSIVKEKEIGTMEQLIVSPLTPFTLIMGKLIPFVLLGFIDICIVLLVGIYWFKVPIAGSILILFIMTGVFLLTTLGLGLLISTISQIQQQALMTSFFLIQPMIIFSGFIFPIPNMPKIFQYISFLNPIRYFVEIIRGIILKGNGIDILWPKALILGIFGIGFITISSIRLRKKMG